MSSLKIFTGTANPELAKEICGFLFTKPSGARVDRFNDGEVRVDMIDDVRNHHAVIIQPVSPPAENFVEVLLLAEALKSASAEQVTTVLPYFGYDRQDRRVGRGALSARVFARAVSQYCDRVLLVDLHSEPTVGFFEVVTDHLYASPVLLPAIRPHLGDNFVVGAPDKGATPRARAYADLLGKAQEFVVFDKGRPEAGKVTNVKIIGDVEGKMVFLGDDIIDTAETIVKDAEAAMKAGATGVVVAAPHALFSKNAIDKIIASPISKVIVTNTIAHSPEKLAKAKGKIEVVSIARYLAEAISRIDAGKSLEPLRNRRE